MCAPKAPCFEPTVAEINAAREPELKKLLEPVEKWFHERYKDTDAEGQIMNFTHRFRL